MRILFTFENPLPSTEADAEVFVTTAKHLAPLATQSWLHVPLSEDADRAAIARLAGMPVVPARAPLQPAALRHFRCGLSMLFQREFRQADLVYTRNLWVAWLALMFGQQVAFDHYRPWPDQIPPLQRWIYRLFCHRRFLVNICHSDYTRQKYLDLGIPADKLHCIRNGFEPERLQTPMPIEVAKAAIGVAPGRKTIVYTGRVNHKKGLHLVIEAAKQLPDHLFILVGSYGQGPIEALARDVPNVRIVPFQPPETLGQYVFAADVLLIPPSWQPLAEFGSTVLPLKLFFYMASGRPILAGDTPDVKEVLNHGENAYLCQADSLDALVAGIGRLTSDAELAARLAATALADSRGLTWEARARKIATVLAHRLHSAPDERGTWSRPQFRAWIDQSRRWLVHLARNRSWILPPDIALSTIRLPPVECE
ncbi:MAG TPA: glycosyltransferase [Aliidongia sp.]|uniref:glycosyltransferase n=1 Tax=Aliidongia sp. TaxID=1914230 RepID=UPI002DDD8CF7|nr:glycosyltransferase [Aliidongia sp.]HEV2677414.1 glycosyltransferase [Aliidongia sp.]